MTTTTEHRPGTVELMGETLRLERPSGRKTSRALALLRAVSAAMPDLSDRLAKFRRDYERSNVIELDRAQARVRYPALPLIDEENGGLMRDEHGQLLYGRSPVDAFTEEDWEKSGHVLRMPSSPSGEEVIAAMFDRALEVAEHHVYGLLALFTLSNRAVKDAHRSSPQALTDLIEARVDEILDEGFGDEWIPLGVAVGELVDEHFTQKAKRMGDRLGNVLRLVGIDLTGLTDQSTSPSPTEPSSDGPTSSTPPSSTDTPEPTDGPPTTPSTSDGPSSSNSPSSEPTTTTANGNNGQPKSSETATAGAA